MVTSFDEWIVFPSGVVEDLKQLVRGPHFATSVDQYAGFRVLTDGGHVVMLVKARLILSTAANHFIPLTRAPSYQVLEPGHVMSVSRANRKKYKTFTVLERLLVDLVNYKLNRNTTNMI